VDAQLNKEALFLIQIGDGLTQHLAPPTAILETHGILLFAQILTHAPRTVQLMELITQAPTVSPALALL